MRSTGFRRIAGGAILAVVVSGPLLVATEKTPTPAPQSPATEQPELRMAGSLFNQTAEQVRAKDAGCVDCHSGIEDMHNGSVILACIDCHGGNSSVRAQGLAKGSREYDQAKDKAHVLPSNKRVWKSAANPERSNTALLKESLEFVRFVNPGDLRVAGTTCGTSDCHAQDVHHVSKSMMTTGAMLWGAALYNNGSFPLKDYRFGESYGPDGKPQRLQTVPQPTPEEVRLKGILPFLDPLPRWEITQMGNILRTFERGGRKAAEIGNPLLEEQPGKPTQNLLSFRGLGTLLTTDPTYLGLQKTRLLDPMLSMMGTNDHPGDYRSSGCTSCHVVYANDRDPFHSGPYAQYGHLGFSASADAAIPKDEPGHPIKHQLTRAIPSSQCVVCHMHPGTTVSNTFYGTTWWDLETDAKGLYRENPNGLSADQKRAIQMRNPEESAFRGKWGEPEFLKRLVDEVNPTTKQTQFADFTGHGWMFRNVFKKDRKGTLLDAAGQPVADASNEKLREAVAGTTDHAEAAGLPVHLKDIHLEKGMHCVDCHFRQDNHGNGKLYGEVRAAIEIDCVDCHGTIYKAADPTSREATTSAAAGGNRLLDYRYIPGGKDRFFKKEGRLYQRSAVSLDDKGMPVVWELRQLKDVVTPGNPVYNEKAALAKTLQRDGKSWGFAPSDSSRLAHPNEDMTCFSCHLSWTPSCFGCHLKMTANQKREMLHNEGEEELRNSVSYNFQTLRDDVFLLGRDGTVTGKRVAPVRSACAVLVSSQNALREWIYSQQQTVSQEGYSGQAFSSHFPHTVRTRETKDCVDCHLSESNDNNAYMAMTLMQGTNFYNWIGRFVYTALGEGGFEATVATERDEPQAVIGSSLHKIAYPAEYGKHEKNHGELRTAYEHPGNDIGDGLLPGGPKVEVLSVQLRGEYLYAATGAGGFRIYDVANIDQKGFSERVTTAPFSPLGQRFYVKSKYATWLASPSTLAVDPTRNKRPENEEAENRDDKQPIPLVYAFLYGTDKYEGLVIIGNPLSEKKNGPGVATLLDGDPNNNFIRRALAFNPGGVLTGANHVTVAGRYAYIAADKGLAIVDLGDPLQPRLVQQIGEPHLNRPRRVELQFRYAFVCDADGVKVIDITDPTKAKPVSGAAVKLAEANAIYPVRTYAYVAAGKQGLVVLDIENPEKPKIDQVYDAGGAINDCRDVKVGMTNVSLFAYLADGHNGLRVVQLTSDDTPGHYGFSPRPTPNLIATRHTHSPALAVSEGIDRDRAIDESGNQLAVFGRRGARPFNQEEVERMFLRNGQIYRVPDLRDGAGEERIRKFFGEPGRSQMSGDTLLDKVGSWLMLGAVGIFVYRSRRRKILRRPPKGFLLVLGCLLGLALSSAVFGQSVGTAKIIWLDRAGERGAVSFNHTTHEKVITPNISSPFKANAAATCAGCHHTVSARGVRQLWKCSDCHREDGNPKNPRNRDFDEVMAERAFHDMCIDCHRSSNLVAASQKAPASCGGCHKPHTEAAAALR